MPIELISNVASIAIILVMLSRYLSYKKQLDVIKGLGSLQEEGQLTNEDIDFIKSNESEYKEKVAKTEANVKISQPILILIAGVLILTFNFQEALIHLNVVVVAFIFMQVDRIHKRNLYGFLNQLKKAIKEEQ